MKISNSKKQLAKIISENGGWREGAESAAQCNRGEISFWHNTAKKRIGEDWCGSYLGCEHDIEFTGGKIPNWHQTILSRDEYFHLYPAPGAVVVENKTTCHLYVTDKPTIEQLAAEYRNRQDYAERKQQEAERKQQEADAAKAEAEAKLAELVAAGKAVGLVLSVGAPEPELVITKYWELLKGDEILYTRTDGADVEMSVIMVEGAEYDGVLVILAKDSDGVEWWISDGAWRFTRRPTKGVDNA